MTRFIRISFLSLALAFFVTALSTSTMPTSASAQGETAQAERTRGVLEEVVSRARKRAGAERAQSVPVAATIITDTMIELNHYNDFLEIARMVPNSNFRETNTFPGVQRFWLRGVGVTFSVPNFDPVVGVVMDGIYVAQNIAAILDTFDMESIEVLRGPQGTLFGRNLAGGAVVARSRRPGDEFNIRGKGTYGRFDRAEFAFGIEGPVIKDKVAAKLAIQYRSHNGYLRDNLSLDGKNQGEFTTYSIRPTIVFTPSDDFDLTIIGDYYARRGDGSPAVTFPPGPNLEGIVNPVIGLTGQTTRDWRETWADQSRLPSHSNHDNYRLVIEANWDLGHGVLTSISGYMSVDALSGAQFDGLPNLNISETRLYIDQEQFSEELRYASTFSDTWDFTFGLYFFDQDLSYGEQRLQDSRVGVFIDNVPDGPNGEINPFGLGFPGHDLLDHKNYAAFLEAHIHLTEDITLTLGGRYSIEKKHARVGLVNGGSCRSSGMPFNGLKEFSCTFGLANGFDIDDRDTWKNFTPKVVLEYQINPDTLVYASWAAGQRSGGWSFRANANDLNFAPRPAFYDEEKVNSFELGLKGDFFDNRLRTNLAAFYSIWKDIQRNLQFGTGGGNIFQTTLNAPKSHVWGLEAEINYIIAQDLMASEDSLRFDGSVGWFDSGYDDFIDFDGDNIDDRNRKFEAPNFTFYLGLTYDQPVGNAGGYLTYRVSFSYQNEYKVGNNAADQLGWYSARDFLDASIRYEAEGGKWYVSVFGKNLLDDKYYESRVTFVANAFGVAIPGMPATWGVEIGFNL